MRQDSSKLDLTGTGWCSSFIFRLTARAVTQLYDSALQESGIRSTQFAILVGIAKKQPVSISALAAVLTIDQSTLTRSVRLLQKEGLITISKRSTMRQRFLMIANGGAFGDRDESFFLEKPQTPCERALVNGKKDSSR